MQYFYTKYNAACTVLLGEKIGKERLKTELEYVQILSDVCILF
jgi:hypothetical protein